jgi:AcrR family transcriptional regulator
LPATTWCPPDDQENRVANRGQRRPAARYDRGAAVASAPPDPATLIPSQRQRRDRIVHRALRMLERRDYEDIQMRDVAERADVALGTVYRYFASKEHLFAAVLVEWSGSLESRVQREPLAGDDIVSQLDDLMERVVTAFERLPQFFRLITAMETTNDPHARALFEEFSARTHRTYGEPLRVLEPDDAAAVLDVLMAMLGGMLREWTRGAITADEAKQRLQAVVKLIFSGPPARRVLADTTTAAGG